MAANTASFNPLDRSPTLVKLFKTRLAPIREQELIAKATCADKPTKPAPGDCCGSSCHPCVMDNYAEELRVWKECWVKWDGRDESGAVVKVVAEDKNQKWKGKGKEGFDKVDEEKKERKMPCAFEW